MRIAFYVSPAKSPENELALALRAGCPSDWEFDIVDDFQVRPDYDIHSCVGVKSARLIRKFPDGNPWVYFDKGYNRDWPRWWRVAVCGHQPTAYLMDMQVSGDRAREQKWSFAPWRDLRAGGHVLYAGSSLKYNNMFDLGDPNEYAQAIVEAAAKYTKRPIIYRPKPSFKAAEQVAGAKFSYNSSGRKNAGIEADLEDAFVMITHGSAAAFDALRAGVPSVVLGHAVTRPISSTSLEELDNPRLASDDERRQLVNALAHCQYHLDEIRGGLLWAHVRSIMRSPTLAPMKTLSGLPGV